MAALMLFINQPKFTPQHHIILIIAPRQVYTVMLYLQGKMGISIRVLLRLTFMVVQMQSTRCQTTHSLLMILFLSKFRISSIHCQLKLNIILYSNSKYQSPIMFPKVKSRKCMQMGGIVVFYLSTNSLWAKTNTSCQKCHQSQHGLIFVHVKILNHNCWSASHPPLISQ